MPGADGFSPRNLRYCQRFYELYKAEASLPQLVADLVKIPWGHHRIEELEAELDETAADDGE